MTNGRPINPEFNAAGGASEMSEEILTMAGVPRSAAAGLTFTGPETVLASSFPVTAAAQSLVASFSVAVAHLHALRSGRDEASTPPAIEVDSIEACAAFQSERHLRTDDAGDAGRASGATTLWDGLSGHYATADGFIQFHTNFPHHRSALLEATGCGPNGDRSAVEAVVAAGDRFELEHLVSEAGGIAAALRTLDEWNQHPHATHIAGRAPLIIQPTTDQTPTPLPPLDAERPLSGVRVLDLTRVIAGPVCGRALAAYGADVMRIGAPGLPVVESLLPDTTLGKRFADCDITTAAGRDLLLRLAAEADVVVTGFRPGALAGYGIGQADLREANQSLIIGTLSAFGADGPWGGRRGFDSITQTATGIVATETEAFGWQKPRPLPCQFLDHGTGYLLALGVVAALANRHRGLGSSTVGASLLTTRNWLYGLGRTDPALGDDQIDDDSVGRFSAERTTPFGQVRHIVQPGRISGLPASWERGPAKPGQDPANW